MQFMSLTLGHPTPSPPPTRSPTTATTSPSLLGAESVLWRYFGDWRLGLVLGRGLLLQVCHPTIGVAEHSVYREDPWGRLRRSLFPIVETIYAADGEEVGARIREAHRTIRGTDHRGRRYGAWEPEAYWFVLASALDSVIAMAERYFPRPLTLAERQRLVLEMREVGLRMGLRAPDMPATWKQFDGEYRRLLRERLENHPTAHEVLETIAAAPPPEWMRIIGPAFSVPTGHLMTLATVGTLPPIVRERLGLGWTTVQEAELRALALAVRTTFRAVPERLRYMPIARAGFDRTDAR
jgi:uncharacterized protein (DUF2236 family)